MVSTTKLKELQRMLSYGDSSELGSRPSSSSFTWLSLDSRFSLTPLTVNSTFKKSWLTIGLGVLALLVLLIFFGVNPEESNIFVKCPLYQHTGIYCSGCGSQRAAHDLLHGDVIAAANHNILLVAVLVLFGQHYGLKGLQNWPNGEQGPKWPALQQRKSWIQHRKAPLIIGIVVVVYMVLRNLPFAIFDILRP